MRRCPVDGCKKKLVLSALIVHINDEHRWSREQIATWLEAVNGLKNGATTTKNEELRTKNETQNKE